MRGVKLAFEEETIEVEIDHLLPTKHLGKDIRKSSKYQTVRASIREVGVIEPLAVFPESGGTDRARRRYAVLDGHLRMEALRELGIASVSCLISTDDEGFTYNRQINRLSAVQEHKMILKAIAKGVPAERIAATLEVDVDRIRARERLLDGVAPEVVELLKDRMVSHGVFPVLRKMKPMRQIETAEMMISSNRFTTAYAKMVLSTTRQEFLVTKKDKAAPKGVSPEDLARMEREMEKLSQDYGSVEDTHGETMLVLVIAKGYVFRLLKTPAIADYLRRHHQGIATELAAAMESVAIDARSIERE